MILTIVKPNHNKGVVFVSRTGEPNRDTDQNWDLVELLKSTNLWESGCFVCSHGSYENAIFIPY